VGETCRFGQPIFAGAREGDFDCVSQFAFVAYRDKEGFDVCSCSDNGTNDVSAVCKKAVGAFLASWFVEVACESALCAADGGFVENESEVRSEAQSTGMRYALAVDEK